MVFAARKTRGFTAVEIAMVASVIAILALIVLPIFRKRAEDARLVAANDDLQGIVKALLLIEADMPGGGYLTQLNDLDNRENPELTNLIPSTPDLAPARTRWNPTLITDGTFGTHGGFEVVDDATYYASTVKNWKGPYAAYRSSLSLANIAVNYPRFTNQSGNFGPITIPGTPWSNADITADRYPMDPWGNPYLLFGAEETIYNIRVIYSLGPNGVPGSTSAPVAADYNRRRGVLGTGDDLQFQF